MVLGIVGALYSSYFPTQYAVQIAVALLVVYVVRTLSQGRKTNRERDLHARIILVTVCPSSRSSKVFVTERYSRAVLHL